MQKFGVENAAEHFMSFNTICDATQVSTFVPSVDAFVHLWFFHSLFLLFAIVLSYSSFLCFGC